MTRQEVYFAHGTCRIEIAAADDEPSGPSFVAHLWLIRDGAARPIVLGDGHVAEIRGRSEAAALSSAITYLEPHFGALSEYAHGVEDFGKPPKAGDPFVVD